MVKQPAPPVENLTVYAALLRARQEFEPVVKDETADVGKFTYKYVELSSLLAAVTPALSKYGLIVVQHVEYDGQTPLLITRLMHIDSDSHVLSRYPLLPARPNDPQALGGAITYARRYALLAILGIAPEDDDGQKASKPRAQATRPDPAPSYAEDQKIKAALADVGKAKDRADLERRYMKLAPGLRKNQAVIDACTVIARRLDGDA